MNGGFCIGGEITGVRHGVRVPREQLGKHGEHDGLNHDDNDVDDDDGHGWLKIPGKR